MKAAFLINNLNKVKFVGKAVASALAQTYPCDIIVSDYGSTDGSIEAIDAALRCCPRGAKHEVMNLPCTFRDDPEWVRMRSCNEQLSWMFDQTDAEWIFQCSSDDYSLPTRIEACMKAASEHNAAGIGTACYFVNDNNPPDPRTTPRSGFPLRDGYVPAGEGIMKMAYGSTIWGYKKSFLQKVGLHVDCTSDVYLGFLASLDEGYYVVATPHHVHYMAEDNENLGFQGKMRSAERAGDQARIHQINELNRFQLLDLYVTTMKRAQELYPMMHESDRMAILNMILAQSVGWLEERKRLHAMKLVPEIM